MDMLAELNRLRVIDGKTPIKEWTGDEEQLQRAIWERKRRQAPQKTEEELIAEYLARGGDIKIGRDASAKGVRRQGGRRRKYHPLRYAHDEITKTKPPLKGMARPKPRAVPADCFTLAELARDKDTDPRYVRGLARKRPELAELNPELGRWTFKLSDRDKIISILWPNG